MNLNKKFDLYDKFATSYNTTGFDFNINVARLFVCAFLIWKLLSRNFSFYGYIPDDVFGYYPIEVYRMNEYIWWTGSSLITDIFTMHWVHWFIERPSPEILEIIQKISLVSLSLFAIFGRGPKNIFAFLSYVILIYLWGHLFLLGQEIDSVALYFGILLVLTFSDYSEVPIWKLNLFLKLHMKLIGRVKLFLKMKQIYYQ